jgi:hypothetical protein
MPKREEDVITPGTYLYVNNPDPNYARLGFPFWFHLITVAFAISFFVVSALAVMAATSSVTVFWPSAITSGCYIVFYAIVGAIIFFSYSRGRGMRMSAMHNIAMYRAYIITIVLGVLIFAVDINWLERFSVCCDSDVIILSAPTLPQFELYFTARLWEMFTYFIIGIVNVSAVFANLYPYR